MRVLFAASEVEPFAKTGGLADVAGALPRALARLSLDVRVVLPAYREIDRRKHAVADTGLILEVPISGRTEPTRVLEGRLAGAPVSFLEADRYYDRDGLYGVGGQDFQDNAERFAFFSRAVVELGRELGRQGAPPDVFHCHDWQTGLVPAYLKSLYAGDPRLGRAASVFTVHNLGYQGLFWHYDMHLTGLGWEHFTPDGLEFWGKISYLKAGLVYADWLTTVSPTYAREIQTAELGCGMDGVLRARADRLVGILNGIDVDEWDPQGDPHVPAPYSARDLAGKRQAKVVLQTAFALPVTPEAPLLAMISRLVDQKGCDILVPVIPALAERGCQIVVLGTGEPAFEDAFRDLAKRYPRQVGVRIAYDNALSHKIEAGADMFLMPSRYEPCGLNQMMSLRYGTVPIVRATGGLADTVVEAAPERGGNGFTFGAYDSALLLSAVDRALAAFRDRVRWEAIVRNGMEADFSWDASARRYADLYGVAVGDAAVSDAGRSFGGGEPEAVRSELRDGQPEPTPSPSGPGRPRASRRKRASPAASPATRKPRG